ncbi:hypothetical protein ES704_04113 [subsurface metagenome]|jgi:hypothetical protein
MNNKIILWLTIIGSIAIAFLSWIVYGESTFKMIFSAIVLVAAIFYFIDFMKRKKTGNLIATLFFLCVAFTLLNTICLPGIFSLVFAMVSLILFIALIYTLFNREKYY